MATVLRTTTEVPALAMVTDDMVEEVALPARWAPQTALQHRTELLGLVSAGSLPAGAVLQQGMLVPRPELVDGQREIAILVDAETGVAGKIAPGDRVDIYATFPGDHDGRTPRSEIVVSDATIIDVGGPSTTTEPTMEGGFGEARVVPVTFALSVEDSLVLTYVESFATKVRLALLAPDDRTEVAPSDRVFTLDGDVRTSRGTDPEVGS
jgi:pilus assembly protein CpaB